MAEASAESVVDWLLVAVLLAVALAFATGCWCGVERSGRPQRLEVASQTERLEMRAVNAQTDEVELRTVNVQSQAAYTAVRGVKEPRFLPLPAFADGAWVQCGSERPTLRP